MPENSCVTLVAVGGNLTNDIGDVKAIVSRSVVELSRKGAVIRAVSRFFSTPAFPRGSGPDFINLAVCAAWACSPEDALALLHDIETDLGRVRTQRWGPRTIDLDLIAAGDAVRPDADIQRAWAALPAGEQLSQAPDDLVLPHPRMQDRAFVLVPLRDIAPDWRHPLTGLTVDQMAAALDPSEIAEIKPI